MSIHKHIFRDACTQFAVCKQSKTKNIQNKGRKMKVKK